MVFLNHNSVSNSKKYEPRRRSHTYPSNLPHSKNIGTNTNHQANISPTKSRIEIQHPTNPTLPTRTTSRTCKIQLAPPPNRIKPTPN